jgi:hypothetical protein
VAHLFAVAALVLENGGDEDEAIAALLHDAAEDQGGEAILDEIGRRFGERVAAIVAACSDTFAQPKPPWRERKEAHLAKMRKASPSVRLVALADKVHNLAAIVRDHRLVGDALWSRFNASAHETAWYYREMLAILAVSTVPLEPAPGGVAPFAAPAGAPADPRLAPLLVELSVLLAALDAAIAAKALRSERDQRSPEATSPGRRGAPHRR